MKRNKLTISLFALSAVLGASSLAMATITYSAFVDTKQVAQQAGYSGSVKESIFLNANIWEVDSPIYYMYAFKNGGAATEWLPVSKTITPVINDVHFTMYVFEFATVKYDRFNFVRINPNSNQTIPSFEAKWNQTADITYSGSVNYYCITDWNGGGNSTYTTHHLSVNMGGNLYFG